VLGEMRGEVVVEVEAEVVEVEIGAGEGLVVLFELDLVFSGFKGLVSLGEVPALSVDDVVVTGLGRLRLGLALVLGLLILWVPFWGAWFKVGLLEEEEAVGEVGRVPCFFKLLQSVMFFKSIFFERAEGGVGIVGLEGGLIEKW